MLGAWVTFVGGVLKNSRPDDPRKLPVWRIASVLAGLTLAIGCFSIYLGHYRSKMSTMISESHGRYQAAVTKQRDETLELIKKTVKETMRDVGSTKSEVHAIYKVLSGSDVDAWSKLARRIAIPQLKSEGSETPVVFFDKGTPQNWIRYKEWLFKAEADGANPALALSLGSGRYYMPGWILGWLLTTDATADAIGKRNSPDTPRWGKDCEDDLSDVFSGTSFPDLYIKYVLFFDTSGDAKRLIAYADAEAFARELKLILDLGGCESVQTALNQDSAVSALQALQNLFRSVSPAVFPVGTVEEVAQAMISESASSGVLAGPNDEYYWVDLANLFVTPSN